MNGVRLLATALMLVLLVVGCKKGENNLAETGAESNAIAITVGTGTRPHYTWSGGNV